MVQQKTYIKQRVALTELLQNTIKDLRKQYNKRGDILSKELGKGASYISQIENGKIKEIDFDSLMNIFRAIFSSTEGNFIKLLSAYIDTLLKEHTEHQLIGENWIHTFIVQEIEYPITDWIIDFIQNKLHETKKTTIDLINRINNNDHESSYEFEVYNYIPNKAYVQVNGPTAYENPQKFTLYITTYYNLTSNYINEILNRSIAYINYINMKIIFWQLFSMGDKDIPSSIREKVSKIMFDNGFLDTFQKWELLQGTSEIPLQKNTESFIFYDNLINNYKDKYDKLKKEVFEELNYSLQQYYKANSAHSCNIMNDILKNFNADAGLTLALLSSAFYEIPMNRHRDFMEDFRTLLARYINNSK